MNRIIAPSLCLKARVFVVVAVIATLLFTSVYGFAADQGRKFELSLESVILFALNNNPEIRIAKEQENQAIHSTKEAESTLYPQVDMTLKGGAEYNNPANFTDPDAEIGKSYRGPSAEFILSANQLIYDGFSAQEEIKRRETLHESSKLQTQLVQERILIDTINAYIDIYRFQHILHEFQGFITRLTSVVEKIEMMVEAGAESKAKLKYARSRLAFAKSDYENTKAALKDSIANLEFMTGRLPTFKAKAPKMMDLIQIQLAEYKDLAHEHNTNFKINASDRQALLHELRSQEGRNMPTLNMIVELNQSHDTGGDVSRDRAASALLQITYKIFDGFAREASEDRIKSQISEIDYRRERAERDIIQRIKQAYNQVKSLETEYMIVRDEIEANTELQALYKQQFELGEGDIINMIEGEERLFASRSRLHRVESDLILNSYDLLRQIGFLDKQRFCESC